MLNQKCGSLALLLATLLTLGFAHISHAQPLQKGVSFGISHEADNNVFLSEDKVSNQANRVTADINVDRLNNDYQTRIHLLAEHEANSAVDDRNLLEGTAQFDVSLLPERLSWTLQDVMSQVRIDALTPLTPDNSVNTQNLSTGPDWRWQITPTDLLNVQLRAEKVFYDSADFIDRDRFKSSLTWTHQFNTLWQAGLGYNWIDEHLSGRADIQLHTANFLLQRNSSRQQFDLALGQTQIQATDGNENVGSENVGSAQWRYQLNSDWRLLANLQRSVNSDIDTQPINTQLINTQPINTQPSNTSNNLGDVFNNNNTLSVDQDVRITSEWLWQQRQLSVSIKRRESRNFVDGQSLSSSLNNDELHTTQQTLRFYNPINVRWWWEFQLTQQQTQSFTTSTAAATDTLDEQLLMSELGYRFNPSFSLTQAILFQHLDEQLTDAILARSNVEGFRYLIGLKWDL
jgi:hypothetical protein